jgi:signal transduction histidine kinase
MADNKKTRILYLDDNREHISDFLRVFGNNFEIYTTGSKKEGLEIAIRKDIGIIVINEEMLEKECPDILETIQARNPEIPIIAIKPEEALQFDTINGEKGAAAFILKPFRSNRLNQDSPRYENISDKNTGDFESESSILQTKNWADQFLQELVEDNHIVNSADHILVTCITAIALHTNSPLASLYVRNDNEDSQDIMTSRTFRKETGKDIFCLEETALDSQQQKGFKFPEEILHDHKIHWISVNSESWAESDKRLNGAGNIKGTIGIPILCGNNVYAIMEFLTLNDYTNQPVILKLLQDIGKYTGFVLEKKRLELDLRRAKDESESANKAKSVFLANMSHELRTPLNAVLGFSQVLQKQYFGALNEKQLEYVSDIVESGRHLLSLINDILDLSKVEAGKMELEISRISIRELLEHSLILIREKSIRHGINLRMEMEPELDMIEFVADERKMKQILFNLLTNASKFTGDGGEISIEASLKGNYIQIRISDNGIGISRDDLNMIFDKFYKTKTGQMLEATGSGLGLPLVKSYVEKHGGKIWAESDGEGKGSRFTFTVPLKQ